MFAKTQCWLFVVVVATSGVASSQETRQASKKDEQRKRWMAVYSEEAAKYQMFRQSDRSEELKLVPKPLLTFTNPVRGRDQHGGAFVWTSDGRPEVFGAIWSVISPENSTKRHLSHELHSLSLGPIHSKHEPRTGLRGPVPNWSTNEAGIVRKDIPAAQAPAKSASLRMSQMRRMAQRFRAKIAAGQVDNQGSLRLLTQPLYRYQSKSHNVLDGGVFAFVMGTDPEIILVIEAVESREGHAWQFAAVPLSNLSMLLDYQEAEVWKCKRAKPYVDDRPHFIYMGVSLRDRVID